MALIVETSGMPTPDVAQLLKAATYNFESMVFDAVNNQRVTVAELVVQGFIAGMTAKAKVNAVELLLETHNYVTKETLTAAYVKELERIHEAVKGMLGAPMIAHTMQEAVRGR